MIRYLKGCSLIQDINRILDNKTQKLISLLINNQAKVYLVGGAVRDYYLKQPIHDLDFEVYNLTFEKLKELIVDDSSYLNETFKTIKNNKIEFSLPRIEQKTGLNYSDYQLSFTNVMPKDAVLRRDFTINTLMYNLNENKLYDFCGGITDLNKCLLKAVDYQHFSEDSIRVLRMLKYQSKYDLKIDSQTYKLAKSVSQELWQQPQYLVSNLFSEIIKQPFFNLELFFDVLTDFLLIEQLKSNITNNRHHPEKSLYQHILGALKSLQLYNIKDKKIYELLFWALFFHDFGKLTGSRAHSERSVAYFEKYQGFILKRKKDIEQVRSLIADHMLIRKYSETNDQEKMRALQKKYGNQFYLLEIVGTCDYAGRMVTFTKEEAEKRIVKYQKQVLAKYWEVNNE